MILSGGFLNKSTGYYYYVQNIKMNKSGWTVINVLVDNKIVKFTNNNEEILFEMKQDNSYNIILYANSQIIMKSNQLFSFKLDVILNNIVDENVYEYTEGLIVDH